MIIDLQKQRHLLQQTTDLTKNFLNWWHEYEIQYLSLPQRRANELPSGIAMLLNSEPERIIIADLMTLWIKISESDNYHFQLAWLNQSTWWIDNIFFFGNWIGIALLSFFTKRTFLLSKWLFSNDHFTSCQKTLSDY